MTGQEGEGQGSAKRCKTEVSGSGVGERSGNDEEEVEVHGEEMDVGRGEEECGKRGPERRNDPRKPSEKEVREHQMTHVPFRSWCRHCVRGQGVEEMCKRMDREDGGVPEVHLDFMFMGEEQGGKTLAFLVGRERWKKATMATVAPRKSSGEWLARRVRAWMVEIGCAYGEVVVKTDNEPALVALVEALGRERAARGGGGMVVEHSPVHSSRSNGVVERSVRTVQGMIRTMRSALEERWGVEVGVDHAIWSWMAEYAGWILTRCQVGRDGRTAYERMKGKPAKIQGLEFGEGVHWKRRREGGPLGKLTCMWGDGIFLGVKGGTGEIIVGDEKGVWVTRTVRRKPLDERWSRENIGKVGGGPWKQRVEGEGDGEEMETGVKIMDKEYREKVVEEDRTPVPKKAIHPEDRPREGRVHGRLSGVHLSVEGGG